MISEKKYKAVTDAMGQIISWFEGECNPDGCLDTPEDLQELYDELDAARKM